MPTISLNFSDGEIWFTPCRYDGTLVEGKNPFTREPMTVPRNLPLSRSEQAAVASVLDKARMPGADNMVKVADGGVAEISVHPSAVMMKPQMVRPTPGLAALLYELLLAGSWCIQTDDAFVVADPEHAQLPKDDPRLPKGLYDSIPKDVVHMTSAADLARALGWAST